MAISISYTIYNFIYGEGHITPNIFSFKHRDEKNPNCAVIDKVTHRASRIQWSIESLFYRVDKAVLHVFIIIYY